MNEVIKKLDNSFRIVIPLKIREQLKLQEGQNMTLKLEGNKIIIEPVENVLKSNLVNSSTISEQDKKEVEQEIKGEDFYECSMCNNYFSKDNISNIKLDNKIVCKNCIIKLKGSLKK